ncbi:MAG: class I SAM-dependent methyltransferase [Bryobacterales bacterium]|nr:class I SAM-dependent methyltransferase [Bryobacterales bacterium]
MTQEQDQAQLWNGPAAIGWVELQEEMDRILGPCGDRVLEAVPADAGRRVLDVGCGTGGMTVAAAQRMQGLGHVTGVDISQPMIAAAQARAARSNAPVEFLCADAAHYDFPAVAFDLILSRFGVMFFDDPVAAFANLLRSASPSATLRFVAWRGMDDNPFMTTAERAAAGLLPNLAPRRTCAPGQFAFAGQDFVRRILIESGWRKIGIQAVDVPCAFPESSLERYFTTVGPVAMALKEADETTRRNAIPELRAAFHPFVDGELVRFTAACWLVTAAAD